MSTKGIEPPESTKYVAITGYKYEYRIGDFGNVQRKLPNGKWRDIKPWQPHNRGAYSVSFTTVDNKRVHKRITSLMDKYFFNGYAEKNHLFITHKNGMKLDCSYWNLEFRNVEQLRAKNPGKSRRVAMVNTEYEMLAVYDSVKEAAIKNYISEKVVYNRVKNRVKQPFDFMGRTFVYIEDYEKRRAYAQGKKGTSYVCTRADIDRA